MKNDVSEKETMMFSLKKGVGKVQKNIFLSQIKKLVFTVALLLFSVLFINEAKAEETDDVAKQMLNGVNVDLDAADKEELGISDEADLSQMQVSSVVYGDVTEMGVQEVNGRETPTYTTYKDVTFEMENWGYITFRVSIYYYYIDGEYAEIYYYAIQKLAEFLTLSGDHEREGFITNYSTYSRLTIYYQVVFYDYSDDTYIATIQIDLDQWGEFTPHLALDKKYDLFPDG